MNTSLANIDESPIKRIKLETNGRYRERKTTKIHKRIEKSIKAIASHCSIVDNEPTSSKQTNTDEAEMITQLKAKFVKTEKTTDKLQILTILPHSWNTSKLQRTFGITSRILQNSKEHLE